MMKASYKFKTVPYHWVILNKIGDLDTKVYVSKEVFRNVINSYTNVFVCENPLVDNNIGVFAIEEWYFTEDDNPIGYIYKEVHRDHG